MRMNRLATVALLIALPFGVSAQDKISAMLSDGDKTIAYTPCEPGEEAGECLTHIVTCEPNEVYGSGLEVTVIGQGGGPGSKPDIAAMARALLDKPYGEAKLRFTIGGAPAEITAHSILVTTNELNGDWDLSVRTMDPGGLLDALTPASSAKVSADMGGYAVQLANSKEEGEALMKFKRACTG